MSKADQLGAGRFGGGVRGVSARRQAVAAATGVPTDGIAPPTELSPHRISLNPDNPRSSLGDLTDLAGSLKTHGQKVAITVMNRDAYLTANPEREADLEADTTHVVIDGSSRLAAAREAQLASIKIMVSDDQGTNSEELLESALVANIHRQDLEELDEARALDRLLKIYGSQTELAKRLHRSQGWVSQRLALLNLTPELQARIGEEPIKLLRAVGNKPAAEQETALQELKDEQARQEAERQQRRQKKPAKSTTADVQDSEKPGSHYRVIEDDATNASPSSAPAARDSGEDDARPSAGDGLGPTARHKDEPHQEEGTPQPVPEPRSHNDEPVEGDQVAEQQLKRFPYGDGASAAVYLIHKMPPDEFNTMLDLLIKHRDGQLATSG
ncbi:ParB/RepB/Spo0J family partition protein [Streptomyces fuscichromogenes]|uniref:Plasmid partitioning protein n=1 Tax=Streptomyces fuscichromogenes TaxID=1324013 RepID=A0A917XPV1_9ACTN|nr:ParB/RepB/Spo0J family partition protein [Streptomyces fuscichromogenes]GGN45382.1 plasmid partitioning protein [Streptomyces fuscichromogenes]